MKSWKDAHLESIGLSEKIQYKGYPTKYAALHGQLGLKTLAQAKAVDHLIVAGGKKPDQIAKIFKNFGPSQFQDIVDLLNVSTKRKDLKDTEQKLKAGFHHENVNEGRKVSVTVDWEHGNPNDYSADWEAEGVFVLDYDPRKKQMEIGGEQKDLANWISDTYGLSGNAARALLRSAKRVR